LKLSLLFTPGFVVTSVPVHPASEEKEPALTLSPDQTHEK
jgi:hypothetical protein